MNLFVLVSILLLNQPDSTSADLTRIKYNNLGLVVDLGVGLWAQPLPMDYDGDGDYDMVVATNDVPYNGIYFFENPGGDVRDPVFKPAVRLGDAVHNITVSYVNGEAKILTPKGIHLSFKDAALTKGQSLNVEFDHGFKRSRANQWKYTDFSGDGLTDIIIGLGVWDDYGWDNAFDERGNWTNGPLHGVVYVARNKGTNESPFYSPLERIKTTSGAWVNVFGAPSPNFADWDKDGDLDLICGSFLDTCTYFQNTGTRTGPRYVPGVVLPLRMDLEMLQVIALDWDRDGDEDLVIGQEDGRVALAECTGELHDGIPEFKPPRFFRQEADNLKIGALCTPFSVDWDGDGDEDLISGDTAGYINFVENLDGGNPPKWAAPVYLKANGETIRIQAGPNGSIQGPAEAKWGYTVPNVADWDHDGDLDIVVNSIWGKVVWFENTEDGLRPAVPVRIAEQDQPVKPAWNWWTPAPEEFITQWRTSPFVCDLNADGFNDLVMLDHEGYLAYFQRRPEGGHLSPGRRCFRDSNGEPLRLNNGVAGKSGRRKFILHDWTGDGELDLVIDSKPNIDVREGRRAQLSSAPTDWIIQFGDPKPVAARRLAGHDTCPTTVDWDGDGIRDLLIGAEDGFLYYLRNPKTPAS